MVYIYIYIYIYSTIPWILSLAVWLLVKDTQPLFEPWRAGSIVNGSIRVFNCLLSAGLTGTRSTLFALIVTSLLVFTFWRTQVPRTPGQSKVWTHSHPTSWSSTFEDFRYREHQARAWSGLVQSSNLLNLRDARRWHGNKRNDNDSLT